jgi:hypothetical protein
MLKYICAGLGISTISYAVTSMANHKAYKGKYLSPLENIISSDANGVKYKDRSGLKIVNSDMKGWGGFQYKLGLNTCPHPFSPTGECVQGGLYYARSTDICKFLDYHESPLLLVVRVPSGDKEVVTVGSEAKSNIKFRSKNLIVEKVFDLKTTSHETLVENGITSISKSRLDTIQHPPIDNDWAATYCY